MMSANQKAFSAGALVMGMVVTILMTVATWVGWKASLVPVLQQQIIQTNESVNKVNEALKKVTRFIEDHQESKIDWNVWKSQIDYKLDRHNHIMERQRLDLEVLGIKTDTNERHIEKATGKTYFDAVKDGQ